MTRFPRTGAAQASLLAGGSILLLLALVHFEGCANVAAPPGGPPDSIPPILIAVYPDSYAVVDWTGNREKVRFEFLEAISEQNLQVAAILYPFEPRPRVEKGKRELRVRPRAGWLPDRIYHIRVEPVIMDLFQNRIEEPILHVISTGPAVPENGTRGTVFDRIKGRPLREGRVDMVLLPDTLRYGGTADSAGDFNLATLPVGEYYAIGYEDLNNNMRADDFDRSDTLIINLGPADTLVLDFQVFRHDTLGPQLVEVAPVDSMIVQLGFDGYLDPDAPVSSATVEVLSLADSSTVALDTVYHAWQYTVWRDSVEDARRDSLLQALDEAEAAAAQDTAGAAEAVEREVPAPQLRPPAPAEQEEAPAEGPGEPAALPDRRLYVIATGPIPPGAYLVRVHRLLNLSGLEGDSEAAYDQPEPPPPEEGEGQEQSPPEPPPDTASAAARRGR
ncbi:MAG: carboxypeptidase regulatory-like domain-containing protein [Gemmatimonadota bacterium]|nr:MAG: carboxypeptidase regulatory-like domain-containing protein [Gemmatimonadota bacterium]